MQHSSAPANADSSASASTQHLHQASQREHRDGVVPSLITVHYASGAATYYVRLSRKHGRKRIRLGTSVDLTLDAARRKAYGYASTSHPLLLDKTVSTVAREYLEAGRLNHKRTVDLDKRRLDLYVLPVVGEKQIDAVTPADVAAIVRAAHKGLSDATRNRIVALQRALYNFAISRGYCTTNPTREMRMLKEVPRTIPTVDEEFISRLHIAVSLLHDRAPQIADLLKVLLLTGLRIGEALSLRWDDINPIAKKAFVRKSKTKHRQVPLNKLALNLLSELADQRGSNEFVFQSTTHAAPINRPYRMLKRAFIDAGLPADFCAHSCRHVFATLAAQAGIPLYTISKLLGHASPTTTLRYAEIGHHSLVVASDLAVSAFVEKEAA
ncbi:tyrosine-type recombinase/integrase [Burkholderia cepacia]|uniref:tyrosine-type recombinase/integrase n=1 Tax=Burkholderia cepacia complex TaxID=87882 RepID=UPI00157AA164|nr:MULTISPECIES: tyrosine-type recombinase/integrase [Burkholderia cepacia complex]MBR8218299.1 tyrosine-type recombinase/integrase [Burkholderia vietnamiensis]NTX48011.1 tyrosine-type recombinase/integrase [Burkholderia cepacia]